MHGRIVQRPRRRGGRRGGRRRPLRGRAPCAWASSRSEARAQRRGAARRRAPRSCSRAAITAKRKPRKRRRPTAEGGRAGAGRSVPPRSAPVSSTYSAKRLGRRASTRWRVRSSSSAAMRPTFARRSGTPVRTRAVEHLRAGRRAARRARGHGQRTAGHELERAAVLLGKRARPFRAEAAERAELRGHRLALVRHDRRAAEARASPPSLAFAGWKRNGNSRHVSGLRSAAQLLVDAAPVLARRGSRRRRPRACGCGSGRRGRGWARTGSRRRAPSGAVLPLRYQRCAPARGGTPRPRRA